MASESLTPDSRFVSESTPTIFSGIDSEIKIAVDFTLAFPESLETAFHSKFIKK